MADALRLLPITCGALLHRNLILGLALPSLGPPCVDPLFEKTTFLMVLNPTYAPLEALSLLEHYLEKCKPAACGKIILAHTD